MSKKERFTLQTGFSGDNILQELLNDEQETGHKLTEEQYDKVYPMVRGMLDFLLIDLEIDLEKNEAQIHHISDAMDNIYHKIDMLSIDELAKKNHMVGAIVLSLTNFTNIEIDLVYRYCEEITLKKLKVI